jgi:hypothetical protein
MQTDPISAATHYREALERILKTTTHHQARQIAAAVLKVTFTRPEGGHVMITGGFGRNTDQPFITLGVSNPTESANPILQLTVPQAREVALQLLESAEAAVSDGMILSWLGQEIGEMDEERAGMLLAEFRAYRDRWQGTKGEE